MSSELSTTGSSILHAQTSVSSLSRSDMITPALTISTEDATTTTSAFTTSDTGSPSSPMGVEPSDGTSGRLRGTTILGIVLGVAVVSLFTIALGLALRRRRRRRSRDNTETGRMSSKWMDRWSDSMAMRGMASARRGTSNDGGDPAASSVALGVDLLQSPPSPSTKKKKKKKQRPMKLYASKSNANSTTDISTLMAQMPSPLATPSPSATSTFTLIRSTTSPKSFAYTFTGTEPGDPPKATVMYTFVSRLPDELVVAIGDQLAVIREFDDGWALCVDKLGKQGVVPVECVAVTGPLDRIGEEIETDLDDTRLKPRGCSLEPPPKVQ